MMHTRGLRNKIISLHEIPLRITYRDKTSLFQNLSGKDNSVSCMKETYSYWQSKGLKVYKNMVLKVVNNIFKPRVMPYKLRNHNCFESVFQCIPYLLILKL